MAVLCIVKLTRPNENVVWWHNQYPEKLQEMADYLKVNHPGVLTVRTFYDENDTNVCWFEMTFTHAGSAKKYVEEAFEHPAWIERAKYWDDNGFVKEATWKGI